jgi:hypothetical protein
MPIVPSRSLLALSLVVLLAACGKTPSGADLQAFDAQALASAPAAERKAAAEPGPGGVEAAVRRYLAVRHDLQVETPPEGVADAWRQAEAACLAMGCEILSSSLSGEDDPQRAAAQLDARVPPDQVEAFLARATQSGRVGRHSKTSEDMTGQVLDTEARIKNMSEFRDNLRRLMAQPGATVKDLIEVERELVRVQSDLDSLASQRKALAQQTERVRVSLQFTARPSVLERGMWAPVKGAVLGAGHMLGHSVAGLITFLVAVLPWLLVLLATAWAGRALWRRRRRSAARAKEGVPAESPPAG